MSEVSIIMPVYNSELFLRESLEYILCQSFADMEIICVNDGSTDRSLDILYAYQKKDKRIKVLTQKNQYAGVARNYGLQIANGRYVVFLDADDFYENNFIEKQYDKCIKYNADICICGADSYDIVKQEFQSTPWCLMEEIIPKTVFNLHDIPEKLFRITSPAPWNKMYAMKFIKRNSLQYQSLRRSNDLYFTYSALALANKITYNKDILVHYRIGNSNSLQAQNDISPLDFYEAINALKLRLIEENLYDLLKQTFINVEIGNFAYNLKSLKSFNGFNLLYDKFIEICDFELEFRIHEKNYFYNQWAYEILSEVLKYKSCEDYLFSKMKKYEKENDKLKEMYKNEHETLLEMKSNEGVIYKLKKKFKFLNGRMS